MLRPATLCLIGILSIAALLGSWGMMADLPYTRMGIEQLHLNLAVKYGSGDFNPHYFIHPPLLSYLLFGCFGVAYLAGHLLGLVPNVLAYERLYLTDPTVFYVIARSIILILSLGGLLAFYQAGKRLFGVAPALIATVFLSVSPETIRWMHYATPTMLMFSLTMLTFFLLVRYWQTGQGSFWLGVVLGLAWAAKYDGAMLMCPILYAHAMRRDGRGLRSSLFGALFGGMLGNPFLFVNLTELTRDAALLYRLVDGTNLAPGFRLHGHPLVYLVQHVLPFGWTWSGTLVALLGSGWALLRHHAVDGLFLSLLIPVLLCLSQWKAIEPRHVIHTMPWAVLWGIACAHHTWRRYARVL